MEGKVQSPGTANLGGFSTDVALGGRTAAGRLHLDNGRCVVWHGGILPPGRGRPTPSVV